MRQLLAEISCEECDQFCSGVNGNESGNTEIPDPNKRSVSYAAGDTIIKQGSLMDFVYFLNKGLVKVVIETDRNRNIILEIVSPQRFIGMNCINISNASPVSFVALTDCHICQIRKHYLLKTLRENEEFSSRLLTSNGNEYMFLFSKLALFGSRNNHGRLASTLLYLESKEFSGWDIYSRINRKELSELAAMSVESMNKILKEFREDLIIRMDDKRIRVMRPDLLEHISRVG